MRKRGRRVIIKFTNRWLYTLIAIGILILAGVGVYAAVYINSATKTGHDLNELQPCGANQVLQMNSAGTAWTCTNLVNWPHLQGIKLTTATHNGNFGGYREMYNWIQNNGCSGYHVCTANEVVNALQSGMSNPLTDNSGAWSNTGVAATYPKGTSSSVIVNDCQGWTYTGDSGMGLMFYKRNYNYGGVLYTGTQPTDTYCSSLYPVLCCK